MRSRSLRFSDPRLCVRCTRCGTLVHVSYDGNFLAMIGHILKLRCEEPKCGFEDWYLESEFFQHPAYVPLDCSPPENIISSHW